MSVPPLIAAADHLTFAEPHWFALVGIVPVLLVLRSIGARRKEAGLHRMIASGLRPQLVIGERPRLDLSVFLLELLGLALLVAALARPQWGEDETQTRSEGRNLIVAIDTSRSMLASDLEPNRLTRARLAADDLVRALRNDRIGLMAFAGNAVLQVPLTIDHSAIAESLEQLDIYSIEKGGTNLGGAIDLALEHFGKIGADRNALIIFTDGEDLEGSGLDAAEKASEKGVLIITVGVGSTLGSIVPDTGGTDEGQFIRDRSGELVKSRLDVETLEKIAARTHGIFINLNARTMNAEMVNDMLSELDTSQGDAIARTEPIERYQWPLGIGAALLVLGFLIPAFGRARRFLPGGLRHAKAVATANATATLALCAAGFLLFPSHARAGAADEAWKAFNDENYGDAVKLYDEAIESTRSKSARARLEFARGAAAYRSGEFDTALDAYSKSLLDGNAGLREQSHYNLGNTLYRRGERALEPAGDATTTPGAPPALPANIDSILEDWESALQHFDDAASLNPGLESATRNAGIVRKRIEELKEQQEQEQEKEQQKKDEEKKDEQEKKEEEQEKQKNEKPDEQEQKDPQDQEKQEPQDGEKEEKEDGEKGEQTEPGDEQKGDEGDKGDEKEEGEGSKPEDKESQQDQGKEKEGESQPGEDGEARQDGKAGDESETGDKDGAGLAEDEIVNPETGYSKLDAARILQMLSDEQLEMKPLRRRIRVQNIDDW